MITTKHDPKLVSGSPKIVQLDNKMSFDALKQATGNKISLLNGKVFKDIHFLLPMSFVVIVANTRHACCTMMRM